MSSVMAIGLFVLICMVLMTGFPVAFTLAGVSLLVAGLGLLLDVFDPAFLQATPNRIFDILTNQTLLAVPLFVFMGLTLERTRLAEDLLRQLSGLMRGVRGGLPMAVMLVGVLMAASTGIVGATVVTMGLLAMPSLLADGCRPSLAAGTICAAGTLGQIIPPSIVLVLLGDVMSNAYQQAQRDQGLFAPETVSVGDLFVGAVIPGLILVAGYLLYLVIRHRGMPRPQKHSSRVPPVAIGELLLALLAPLMLMLLVLGSIISGVATPTEAAGVGASGALLLALVRGRLSLEQLRDIMRSTVRVTGMVFMILIGAAIFSLTFKGFGGHHLVHDALNSLPGGAWTALLLVMLLIFLLGFILDFIEITFIVVPIVGPVLLAMGFDPVWLAILIAMNLQTSFLTPPFGFALFYLRGVAPDQVRTSDIYRGVMPFIAIQLAVLALIALWPELATWLPDRLSSPS